MDDDAQGNWHQVGHCDYLYDLFVNDSRKFEQDVKFTNYTITVEVRSKKDPHLVFHDLTEGRMKVDEDPIGEVVAGVVLLLISLGMITLGAHRTYRCCFKKVIRPYIWRQRAREYQIQADHDAYKYGVEYNNQKGLTQEEKD